MKKLLPIVIGGGVGGPVLIIILILIVYPNLFVHGLIIQKFEQEFGGVATAEGFSFSWKRGVQISKLSVQGKDGEKPVLTADSIYLKFSVLPLLKGDFVIKRLTVNRPELVLHIEDKEGDRHPVLAAIAGLSVPSGDETALTGEMYVRVIDGTVLFEDASGGRPISLENFNLTSSGINSGDDVLIEGGFDVIAGGVRDHVDVSGSVRGLENGSLGEIQAELDLNSGFAVLKAVVDMSNLRRPGEKVAAFIINADLQKTSDSIGYFLPLPEGIEISGNLDSEVDAIAQPEGLILLTGTASGTGLYIKAKAKPDVAGLFDRPIQAAQAVSSFKVAIDPKARLARIENLVLDVDGINMDLSGDVHADGALNTNVHISASLDKLTSLFGDEYRLSDEWVIAGNFTSDTEVGGKLGETITFKGSSTVTGLDFIFKSFEYTDPKFTVGYDLDFDHEKDLLNVRTVEGRDGFFTMKLEQFVLELRGDEHYQGKLYIMADMLKIGKLFKVQELLGLKGIGEIDLKFEGNMEPPFYEGLKITGTLGLDKSLYDEYEVSNISLDEATLEDNHINITLRMLVNGAPAEAVLDLDPIERAAEIKRLHVGTDRLNVGMSGVIYGQGRFNATVDLSAALEEVKDTLARKYEFLDSLTATGNTKSNIEIEGTIGDVITLGGSTRIEDISLEYERYKYAEPYVTLGYGLDYNSRDKTAYMKRISIVSDMITSNLDNVSVTLGEQGHYQGDLSLDCDIEGIYNVYPLFAFLSPKGMAQAALKFQGTTESPLSKGINGSGYIKMDGATYENPHIKIQATDIATDAFAVTDGLISGNVGMLLNGAPANIDFDLDPALGIYGGPYVGREFHMREVPLTYTLEGGDLSGLVTLDVYESHVEGLKWDENFQKTLTAKGQVKVEEGEISATEILSTVFMGLGEPGVAQQVKLVKSDFEIVDERIYTREFYMDGDPFILKLSGWMGFDRQLDYDAVLLLSGKTHKGVQKVFRTVIKDSPIPLRITGDLSEPKIKFVGSAKLKSVLVAEKVLQGQEAIVRTGLAVPKKVLGAPTGVLKGIGRLLGGGQKAEEDPEEAPDEAKDDSDD
ncbi:MAG: hypothetical protein GY800_02550 [Planctomycetes bacterium]|nr:hypothetical protein [Planctomycetota bacterium]